MQTEFDPACLIWDRSEIDFAMAWTIAQDVVAELSNKCARFYIKFLLELHRDFPGLLRNRFPGV